MTDTKNSIQASARDRQFDELDFVAITPRGRLESDYPFHELHTDGIYVMSKDRLEKMGRLHAYELLSEGEQKILGWAPRLDVKIPALPFPFSACDLAAFMLDGCGASIAESFELFELELPSELQALAVDEVAFNQPRAKTVLLAALELLEVARVDFPDSTSRQVSWLLDSQIHVAAVADPASILLDPETPNQRRQRLLNWCDQEIEQRGERGALARVTAREKAIRPTAERSNVGKEIKKAREARDERLRAGGAFKDLGS